MISAGMPDVNIDHQGGDQQGKQEVNWKRETEAVLFFSSTFF